MEYKRLKGLTVDDFQHPSEQIAFDKIRKIPYIDLIVSAFIKYLSNIKVLPEVQGDCYRITEDTNPRIYKLYETALERLDMPEKYPLFVKFQYDYNATAYGGDSPFIQVHSSVIQNMSDDELLYLLGHEIGHLKGKHSVYKMMMEMFVSFIASVRLPFIHYAASGLHIALLNWYRANEYSADRAGMLAAGSAESAINTIKRLLGADSKNKYVSCTTEDILAQNADFSEINNGVVTKILYNVQLLGMSHPFLVSRAQEAYKWAESGHLDSLINRLAE